MSAHLTLPGLETVRIARGITQADLARRSGISQAVLSKSETSLVPVPPNRARDLAEALECRVELLELRDAAHITSAACVFHRKRANTTVGQAKQARCQLALVRIHAEALLDLVGAAPTELPREEPSADDFISPENIARRIRGVLGIEDGPVLNLTRALERAGVIIAGLDLGGRRLDAISDWLPGRRPVLAVNNAAPADRRRFSLAHEVGHAVMHDRPSEGAEAQADRFASELLMPTTQIRGELGEPTLEKLLVLKERWGVSAAALLRKARDLGLASEYQYRRLNMEMSAAGWNMGEPIEVAEEEPWALSEAFDEARASMSDLEIAERVYLLPSRLDETFAPRRSG